MNDFRNRDFFHEGMREFQDLFDGRRTAEAIETNRKHYEFWDCLLYTSDAADDA